MASLAPLKRGLTGRCPNCGDARVIRTVWEIKDECPACHYSYVREDGYWVGAMTVLMALMLGGFAAVIITGFVMTWPDTPVMPLTIATFLSTLVIGSLAYGWAKTIWVGIDLSFNPASDAEQAKMDARRAAAGEADGAARD